LDVHDNGEREPGRPLPSTKYSITAPSRWFQQTGRCHDSLIVSCLQQYPTHGTDGFLAFLATCSTRLTMATIEPRLIHLLNKSPSPEQHPPPIQPFNSSLSLPPIDHDSGGQRGDRTSQQQIPSFSSINEVTDGVTSRPTDRPTDRITDPYSLDLLLRDPAPYRSSQTQSTWNDSFDTTTDRNGATKKRQRNQIVKDDFVQLPQPLKKQRSAHQVVPPIINGLYSPPENAGVFPPILYSESSVDKGGRTQSTRHSGYNDQPSYLDPRLFENFREEFTNNSHPEEQPAGAKQVGKRRKETKPRRPWTEEESTTLLLGVKKHGKGNWTKILEDPDFNFNQRNPTDLKDRFRSICPEELKPAAKAGEEARSEEFHTRRGVPLGMLLASDDEQFDGGDKTQQPPQRKSDPLAKRKTGPRSHRKDVEDLRKLGIDGPLKESGRRKRTLFTKEDDEDILSGLELYGPQWTVIRNDSRFNLHNRRPTDLRDRIRNKYADVFKRICGQRNESGRANSLLEPSVSSTIQGPSFAPSSSLEPALNRRMVKETMPARQKESLPGQLHLPVPPASTFDLSDPLPSISNFDLATEHFHSSGMDFSRLRLSGEEELPSNRGLPHSIPYSDDQQGYGTRSLLTESQADTAPDSGHFKLPSRHRSMSPTSRVLDLPALDHGPSTNNDTAGLPPLWKPSDILQSNDSSHAEAQATHRNGPFYNILH
jgi:hypothetical protein